MNKLLSLKIESMCAVINQPKEFLRFLIKIFKFITLDQKKNEKFAQEKKKECDPKYKNLICSSRKNKRNNYAVPAK